MKIEEPPSASIRDWLESDLFIELHSSAPKFELKVSADDTNAEPQKDVILGEENMPEIETQMLGVSIQKFIFSNRVYSSFR